MYFCLLFSFFLPVYSLASLKIVSFYCVTMIILTIISLLCIKMIFLLLCSLSPMPFQCVHNVVWLCTIKCSSHLFSVYVLYRHILFLFFGELVSFIITYTYYCHCSTSSTISLFIFRSCNIIAAIGFPEVVLTYIVPTGFINQLHCQLYTQLLYYTAQAGTEMCRLFPITCLLCRWFNC